MSYIQTGRNLVFVCISLGDLLGSGSPVFRIAISWNSHYLCLHILKVIVMELNSELKNIAEQTRRIITSLLDEHPMKRGSIFVIGCSSSEVAGGVIGKNSSEEIGKTIFQTANEILSERGVFLACQCCEHLNRSLVIEEACAEKYGYEAVSVVPWLHGGGSFATAAYHSFITCGGGAYQGLRWIGYRRHVDRYALEGCGCSGPSQAQPDRCGACGGGLLQT